MPTKIFTASPRGKLLLTGEYFVLGGAQALAVPTRFSQKIEIEAGGAGAGFLYWQSLDADGSVWFEGQFALPSFSILENSDDATARRLAQILQTVAAANPAAFPKSHVFRVRTQADFPRDWGLGTSSTLVAGLAKFASIDPYFLLEKTFGGSGYDIACAFADRPILYQLVENQRQIEPVGFHPPFAEQLFFIFLGKKMDSRAGIKIYREKIRTDAAVHAEVSQLTHRFLAAENLQSLETVVVEHENLVATALDLPKVKDLFFKDFWGEVKSLGAWGGDFVLATSDRSAAATRAYFFEKGYPTCLAWSEIFEKSDA